MPGLADSFLRERDGAFEEAEDLEAILAAHVETARRVWPAVALPPDTFVRHLARRVRTLAELRSVRAADVYLACACAAGDPSALAAFEEVYLGEVDATAARIRARPDLAVEVKQMLRRILFVSEGKRPAAAGEFSGRGDLRGWIRVAAMRELVRLLQKEKREVRIHDEAVLDLLSVAHDPELGYLREAYRADFAESVRAAFSALPPHDRSLLRYQLIDGLSIDEIGALHGVHRATAARRLERARAGILERARAELCRRLGIRSEEVDSIIRLVQSRLDVSLERLL